MVVFWYVAPPVKEEAEKDILSLINSGLKKDKLSFPKLRENDVAPWTNLGHFVALWVIRSDEGGVSRTWEVVTLCHAASCGSFCARWPGWRGTMAPRGRDSLEQCSEGLGSGRCRARWCWVVFPATLPTTPPPVPGSAPDAQQWHAVRK